MDLSQQYSLTFVAQLIVYSVLHTITHRSGILCECVGKLSGLL